MPSDRDKGRCRPLLESFTEIREVQATWCPELRVQCTLLIRSIFEPINQTYREMNMLEDGCGHIAVSPPLLLNINELHHVLRIREKSGNRIEFL